MAENGYPKPSSLNPTSHSWISHDGKLQPFLGQFIADVRHVSQARLYLMHSYVFKDATSPHILLSYTTSEQLGILQFNVSNLVAQVHIDAISLPTPSGLRKTTKMKMFSLKDPVTTQIPQKHCNPSPSLCISGKRKTMKTVTFRNLVKDHVPLCHTPSIHSDTWPKPALKVPRSQVAEVSSPIPQLQSAFKPNNPDLTKPTISSNVAAWDIVTLIHTFPGSFDTIGNMPRTYTYQDLS